MSRVLGPLAILVLIGLGFFWLMSGGRDEVRGLDTSQIGLAGLAPALRAESLPVRLAGKDQPPMADEVDLRILPLYDLDLQDNRPETIGDTAQRTISFWDLQRKLYVGTPLLVLPKWRWAAVQKAIAAPQTMIPLADYATLFDQLGLAGAKLQREAPGFQTREDGLGHSATLFAAQGFVMDSLPANCTALRMAGPNAAALIRCDSAAFGATVHVLADPDLLNNHGLTLGENAKAAAALVRLLRSRPQVPVYIDPLAADLVTYPTEEQGRVEYERGPSELWRYFASPLGEIWGMLAILLALFLWRGARRFGPVAVEADETIGRSRAAAVASRARLIRLTGMDGAMVADYIRSDLSRMAEAAFGRGKGEMGRLFPLLARRNEDVARAFRALAQDLMNGAPRPQAQLLRDLDTYHQLQRTLTHGDDA